MKRMVLSLICLFGFFQSSFAQDQDRHVNFGFHIPPKTGFTYFKASGYNVKKYPFGWFEDDGIILDTTIYVENEDDYCIQLHMGSCEQFNIFYMVDSNLQNQQNPFLMEMLNKEGRPIQILITMDSPLTMNYIFRNHPTNAGIYHINLDQVNKTNNYIERLNWEDYKISIKKAKSLLNPKSERK